MVIGEDSIQNKCGGERVGNLKGELRVVVLFMQKCKTYNCYRGNGRDRHLLSFVPVVIDCLMQNNGRPVRTREA